MPIPDFESIMLPVLEFLKDDKEKTKQDIVNCVVDHFELTENERNAEYPKSKTNIIYSKTHFAQTYLKQAGLIQQPQRGLFKITQRGLDVLSKKPDRIDVNFLNQFNEFQEFRSRRNNHLGQEDNQENREEEKTPEELLEEGYQKIRESLSQELLDLIRIQEPRFLEKMVVELLLKMGYGGSFKEAGKITGKSGDKGIDGVIKGDKLGFDLVYLQAKRYGAGVIVGSPEIREFIGSLSVQNANKGVFITTSSFSDEAKKCAEKSHGKIILIDGYELVDFMIDYNIGVQLSINYEIKKIDGEYFKIFSEKNAENLLKGDLYLKKQKNN